jgi:hypothetical protein
VQIARPAELSKLLSQFMPPLVPSAKATLSYPLYACDFDPLDSSRLVVGGGGGAGRSGVGNKIVRRDLRVFLVTEANHSLQTLLDTSKPEELEEICEIDLSKDEDNVTSLAVGQRKGQATLVYAGVNSSPKDVEKGKNVHFRVFGIEPAVKGKGKSAAQSTSATRIAEVSRSKLFSGTEKDSYQRVTRLSKPYPNQTQLGAVTTGLAKKAEIVLFDTSATSPPTSRGGLESNKEAVDVDFIQTGDKEFLFAYCNEHDVFVKEISSKTDDEEPKCVYVTPASDSFEKPTVPSFRALRWLTKDFLLMLTNIHSQGGVVLQILRLPPSGKGHCRISQSHRLPSRITKATGLAVANLTPPLSPSSSQDYTQFVIAVAGHDISISLFKVDLQVESNVSMVTKIKPFRTFKSVHPLQITALSFSNFTPPTHPITASTPPQYLKLASVGVSNTVVVHTFPLFPVPLSVKRDQSKTPRYVVALPSDAAVFGMGIIASVIGIMFGAIIIQCILEIRGGVPSRLGARNHLPVIWQEALGRPYEFPEGYNNLYTPVPKVDYYAEDGGALRLPEFLERLKVGEGEGVIVVQDSPDVEKRVEAHLHNEDLHGPHGGKTWEELGHEQKEGWKKKLKEAGHWAEDMGETVLEDVVFGELAEALGQAIAGG